MKNFRRNIKQLKTVTCPSFPALSRLTPRLPILSVLPTPYVSLSIHPQPNFILYLAVFQFVLFFIRCFKMSGYFRLHCHFLPMVYPIRKNLVLSAEPYSKLKMMFLNSTCECTKPAYTVMQCSYFFCYETDRQTASITIIIL